MANPTPCSRHDGTVPAHLLVTDLTPDFGVLGQPTQGLCMECFFNLAYEKMQEALQWQAASEQAEAQLAAETAPEASGDAQEQAMSVGADIPALERVERDEGAARVAPASRPPKSRKKTDSQEIHQDVPEKAEAAHVDS